MNKSIDPSPFFSIIIPTYNRPSFLMETLTTIANQTFRNFEVVVINDGSYEDYSLVEDYLDKTPNTSYTYKRNEGRSTARNTGIDQANGQYICLLDDDDSYKENHLESLYEEIIKKDNPVALFFTLHELLKENGEVIKVFLKEPRTHRYGNFFSYLNCNSSTVCIHKDILMEKKFNTKIHYWEDWDLWLSILKHYPQFSVLHYTVQIRYHEGQTTKNSKNAVIDSYNGIKWMYKQHADIIPPRLYQTWKSGNLISLSLIALIEKNNKRSLFLLRLASQHSMKIIKRRIFWVLLLKAGGRLLKTRL